MYRAYSNNGRTFRDVEPDWALDTGEILFDHEPTSEELLAAFPGYISPEVEAFRLTVKAALDATDIVAIRCCKAGITFPTEWQAYTAALRTMLSSTDASQALPVMPAYPAGS